MSTRSEQPSPEAVVAELASFFSASAETQRELLAKYRQQVEQRGGGPAIEEPLLELATAFCRFRDPQAWRHRMSANEASLVEEIGELLSVMIEGNASKLFDEKALAEAPLWRLTRRLCGELVALSKNRGFTPVLSLWELMCYVAD